MSGHSKWSTIKHQKGATDAKRGKIFTKLGHNITLAARQGGSDPAMNARLALAIELAKKANLPKDNIERAIKRGTGETGGAIAENIIYEGYGPNGTAILIETITDNRNRTISEIRAVFNKYHGKLAESGSVAYLFKQRAVLIVSFNLSADEAELAMIEADVEDYQPVDDGYIVYADSKQLATTKLQLEKAGLTVESAELKFEPTQTIQINDQSTADQIMKVVSALEELDDVTDVIGNFALADSLNV